MAAHHDTAGDALDELYQVPLNEFTARRNALAKSAGGADAATIRALAKPSIVAWAVNQVYWRARSLYDRLMKTGERLRHAQIAALEGRRVDVRTASEAHRRAVAEAVAEAGRLAGAAGSHPSPDALMRTFEAISLAPDPPENPGRLSEALQPAGFEALTGVTPKPVPFRPRSEPEPRAEAPPAAPSESKRDERERRRREAAEARRRAAEEKERQAEIRRLKTAVETARSAEARARKAWERAQEAVREAEQQLAAIKSEK